ncbi:MAG: MarR family winged helix-turn-helix transcriptional regulator [Neisseria sp.]|nr:MarR family winged helix-turn-helix transcriptional regulator [Neisseria sp.]
MNTENRQIPSATAQATFSYLTTQVFQLNGLLLAWGDHFCADLGLTSARWQMLGALDLADAPQTSPQLAERMGMTRQGAQKQLNLLLESGLVEAADNPAHKRSPLYRLSEEGRAVYAEIHRRWCRQVEVWQAGLEASDLQAAEKVLTHIIGQVKKHR